MSDRERNRRWRLILGEPAAQPLGGVPLDEEDSGMDEALAKLYDRERKAGLGASAPGVVRWLGDIRSYFPSSVVRVLQKDAMERLQLDRMLLEPELLSSVEPDVHLVAQLVALKGVIPARTRETARAVVRRVVEEVERRLAAPLRQAVRGSLRRASRTRRPRPAEIDFDRTIRANLRHWIPRRRSLVPESLIGRARRKSALREVILLVDQSGSMAASVVYSGIFAAVLASIPSLRTRLVVFDTAVADLTEELRDPIDVLFGTQLGGGTDIDRALAYVQPLIARPRETIVVLISDLVEGGNAESTLRRAAAIVQSGAALICLLALSDEGAPAFDERMAARLAALGAPAFACTPDLFPELMAAAIERRDVARWAAGRDITVARPAAG
jgi:Mg-chelatase subunit ChlD